MANKKNTTINMSLESSLSNFYGNKDEDITFFINQVKNVANLEQWSETKKILVLQMHLKGNALDYLINNESAKNETKFENLCNLLLGKFARKTDFNEIQNTFNQITQKQGQKVKDLAEEITKLGELYLNPTNSKNKELIDLAEKMKISKFLEALRADLQLSVRKRNPKSFSEAIQYAIDIEQALECMGANQSFSAVDVNTLFKQQLETNKNIQNLQQQLSNIANTNVNNIISQSESSMSNIPTTGHSSRNRSSEISKVSCHICGKPHLTTKCWYFPRDKTSTYNRQNFSRGYRRYRGQRNRGNSNFEKYHPYNKNLNF